jgi:hypothetical protein
LPHLSTANLMNPLNISIFAFLTMMVFPGCTTSIWSRMKMIQKKKWKGYHFWQWEWHIQCCLQPSIQQFWFWFHQFWISQLQSSYSQLSISDCVHEFQVWVQIQWWLEKKGWFPISIKWCKFQK